MYRAPRRSRARVVAGVIGLAGLAAATAIALPAKAPAAKATPKFDFGVNLTKVNDTTWRGRGTEKRGLGKGTMTLTGLVIGDDTTSHPTFRIKFAKGEVRGCTETVLLRRPGDRIVGRRTGTDHPHLDGVSQVQGRQARPRWGHAAAQHEPDPIRTRQHHPRTADGQVLTER